MKIIIANSKNESFEQAKARTQVGEIQYKGFTIRKHWNGYNLKGITLGYKFGTEDEAKKYADLVSNQIKEVTSNEWPETRN